MFEPEDRLK